VEVERWVSQKALKKKGEKHKLVIEKNSIKFADNQQF